MTKTVAIVSGGMDSVTLAHKLAAEGDDLVLVSVHYGQRHSKELAYAGACASRLGAQHLILEAGFLGELLTGSALTDHSVDVPEGHYADESMKATVVPNRNAMMLSMATAVAVAQKADRVATGVHAGDHPIYPDCRPEFIEAFDRMARIANEGFCVPDFHVVAPFVNIPKDEIARIGDALGVPWDETWSCYQGGAVHCGRCGTCVERREAFDLAGVEDPTLYEG